MIELHQGDCMDIMPTLEEVDIVITDPPYGLSFQGNEWDKEIPRWLWLAKRLTKRIIFTTAPTTLWDYPRPDWVGCWHRPASNSRTKQGGFNHWTPVVIYGDIKLTVDTISMHAIKHSYSPDFPHPSPKPESLLRWIVLETTSKGDTILDPFMGSGTTGKICAETDRNFIGIEIEKEYYDIAEKRIRQAQSALF